ncbi:metallophosphoesterase family protein [Modestobacter roseus]|nr:metallophosphoesterase [Modestobacter roseus]MQA35470.1 metallophosphoesterase [Modestobacter roseus]
MSHQPGDQLPLPFPPTRGERARQRLGRARDVAARVLSVVMRWVLRIALPLLGAAAALQAFPYHATVQGIPFEVQGSLFSRPVLSADTTLGSWEFPDFVGLPFGVHISPEDVDVLQITRAAEGNLPAFVERLQADFAAQVPRIATWLLAEFLIGLAVGLAVAAAINMSVRYLRGRPRRPSELRYRARQLGAAGLALAAVTVYGVVSYNPDWVRESRLTGSLAAAQLFPDQLSQYYTQRSKALDVLGSIVGIQAELQSQVEDDQTPQPALQIMYISDMHLAANYPLVAQYAATYDVDLIINTGDEGAFGPAFELTPGYLDALRAVTAETPMLWVAGNHDSPETEQVMRSIPGVTVLGSKTATSDGFDVSAGLVDAFGLTIAGLPDPRVYGGPGEYGADAPSVVEPLQRRAVQEALEVADPTAVAATTDDPATTATAPPADGSPVADGSQPPPEASSTATRTDEAIDTTPIDVFALHEPVAAEEVREVLENDVRLTVSGHTHQQSSSDELQDGDGAITLVEGSTGAGGLDNIVRGQDRPPISFSIGFVSEACQFTRIMRFQITPQDTAVLTDPATAADVQAPEAFGDDVTASTVFFRPQQIDPDRTCDVDLGISDERPWPTTD